MLKQSIAFTQVHATLGQRRIEANAQCTWLLAANTVQGEAIGYLNMPAVMDYKVKTTNSLGYAYLRPT